MKKSDEKLYEEAEARVGWRKHFTTYLIINIAIWLFWYFTRAKDGNYDGYWPIWATLGWGIGIVSHYIGVFGSSNAVEKEFQKLKERQERGNY